MKQARIIWARQLNDQFCLESVSLGSLCRHWGLGCPPSRSWSLPEPLQSSLGWACVLGCHSQKAHNIKRVFPVGLRWSKIWVAWQLQKFKSIKPSSSDERFCHIYLGKRNVLADTNIPIWSLMRSMRILFGISRSSMIDFGVILWHILCDMPTSRLGLGRGLLSRFCESC